VKILTKFGLFKNLSLKSLAFEGMLKMGGREKSCNITMVMFNRNMVAKVELSENLTFFVPLNINLLQSKNRT
jgi:hypothetical protein